MNRSSDAFTRVICEYWPSGLPIVSGLWIVISGAFLDMLEPLAGTIPYHSSNIDPPGCHRGQRTEDGTHRVGKSAQSEVCAPTRLFESASCPRVPSARNM